MTVYTLQAAIPEIDVAGGMQIRLEAVDPTSGAAITGVSATAWAIYGIDISDQLGSLEDLIPGYTPNQVEEVTA